MSDNIKKIDLSTPGRILDAGDIRRKKDKLSKTKEQLKNLDPSSRKYHRKAFKAEKTEGQIESGRAGIQGFKMPFNMVKNNSAIKEVTTEEVRRVPEYPPVRELQKRFEKPTIVDDTYARNIQRNIEKHKRQDAMIEADRARELERQLLERDFQRYVKPAMEEYIPTYETVEPGKYKGIENYRPILEEQKVIAQDLNNQRLSEESSRMREQARNNIIKRNSSTPYKLPHQSKAAPKQTVSSSGGNDLNEFLKRVESRKITNHLGTIHVIAIANLCELAAGTLMEGFLHKSLRWIPKGMNIEYLKKANSRLNAIAIMPKNIEQNKKSDVAISVSVRDSNDTEVVRAEIIMYLTPK